MSFDTTEVHPFVRSMLIAKRNRSFSNDQSEVYKLMNMAEDVELFSPGGIYLETTKAFKLNNPLVNSFVERMSRALLYEEFGLPYFLGQFPWRLNPSFSKEELQLIVDNLQGKELSNIFWYRVSRPNGNEPVWVSMFFYEAVHIWTRVEFGETRLIKEG